ncbi:DsbA family oxidoreductase [Paraburkholderia sediminicola]|uniref:DsbA family oxidoreductase n=1 Tax=Paraburkholderia sediminicola TaxID=458836 RepID=UPI0038B878F2
MPIDITVTHDFVCPWCYIGINRLLHAIDSLSDDFEWQLSWMPLELNPSLPLAGIDRASYRTANYGESHGKMLDAQIEAQARYDGIGLDMRILQTMSNSRPAHRVRLLAQERNLERAFIHAVYRAYFECGMNIGVDSELARIARSVHISEQDALECLKDPTTDQRVVDLERGASQKGIREVPHFQIGPIPVSGAVPVTTLKEALARAANSDLPPPGQGFCAPDDEDCAGSP